MFGVAVALSMQIGTQDMIAVITGKPRFEKVRIMKIMLLGIAIILFSIALTMNMNSNIMTSSLGIGFVGLCQSITGLENC